MASEAFKAIPELDGVITFFMWNLEEPASMPTMIARGRDGDIRHPGQLHRALFQIIRGTKFLIDRLNEILGLTDEFAETLAKRITTHQQELIDLNDKIQKLQQERQQLVNDVEELRVIASRLRQG